MKPLLNAKQCAAVLNLAQRLRSKDTAGPFLPLIPRGYSKAQRKIMFIGKATHGPFGQSSVAYSVKGATTFVATVLDGRNRPNSAFWRFLARTTGDLLGVQSISVSQATQKVIWSNLLKVGSVSGNPKGLLRTEQHELAVHCLRSEVSKADPEIVILMTDNYEIEVWASAFEIKWNDDGWERRRIAGDAGAVWMRRSNGRLIFWTRHPGRKNRAWIDGVVRLIADQSKR